MTVNRTTLLDLPLPVTGTESGTWGDTTNNGLTEYLDIAVAGMTSLTSANFTAGALTISNTTGTSSATNIAATSAQYATIKVSSLATNSTITAPSSNRSYRIINADGTYSLTIKASGQTGVVFSAGQTGIVAFNGTDYVLVGSASGAGNVTLSGNNAFTGANTFYNATGQTFAPTSTNDGIIVLGRAGGSSSYRVTLSPTTLSASRTLTLPDATDTVATIGTAQTFTAAQTFRAANAIRSEAASTQDAIVIAGRAGGSGSYAITLTPATLAASRTLTLPEPGSNETLGYLNVPQNVQTGSYTLVLSDAGKHIYRGSGSAATWTIPANSSVAYAIGTALTFINYSATSVSIAITTDTMRLSSAGTTGTRTLAQYGSATAIKVDSTNWIISVSGLT